MKAHIRKKCFSGEKRELEKDVQTFFSRKKNFFLITANDKFSVSRRINRLRNQFFRINFWRFEKKNFFWLFLWESTPIKSKKKNLLRVNFFFIDAERKKERKKKSQKRIKKHREEKREIPVFCFMQISFVRYDIVFRKKGREMSLIRLLLRKKLTHARTRTHMHAHTRTHTHTLLHSHMLYYIQSVPQWQSIAISLFLSNSHIPSHSHTQSFSITFSSTISLSLTLSLSHSLSLTLSLSYTCARYSRRDIPCISRIYLSTWGGFKTEKEKWI